MKLQSFDIDSLLRKGEITSELELEQSLLAERQLRILAKENPSIKEKRSSLRDIISSYEAKHWSLANLIEKEQLIKSDEAEVRVEEERIFNQNRKEIIKSKLATIKLNQQEFGQILGHNNKSYMSELMNGISPFSLKDLIVISKLLQIDLKELVFTSLPMEDKLKIVQTIKRMDKPEALDFAKEFVMS